MKACPIRLKDIIKSIGERELRQISEGGGWCDDVVSIQVTREELENLQALAIRFGNITPTNEELDA